MSHVSHADLTLGASAWTKPWSGSNGGNCVEVKQLGNGYVAVRQSQDPDGPALIFTAQDIAEVVRGAKAGEADFLLS
ncbi:MULTISPECIES: DUF397 domain-containing protein [Streptomyces]|uniref:DUF397 domain-containing protein n=1 Tax=Streptomyces tsukubensis (strain DSM 42081 / NBRC 108919 / NRRL 18488 / 9993) TaxID=1114943 RepID=I2MU64_STRT9|nr:MULTISPECIES: DUF397 domain-containing protein [Streptomyces]AZK92855.1 DUF397 domain-containing protein [Streptomyces tsukubensis]EIF88311.1 hypothetical protein [Streptomyces tsukubensis NRRL18488]MYS66048.1 DUF397 domain-containing protein [Streptomyces sp. SID5473]QKM70981.1 DUF397 domain-containing protein [Streptomyces tsukubensis NRRL18488]TAI41761.1 DUF397 domain-containing protein [Streptomyces tsukubensis]